jgi:hypothetical protein
MTRAYEYLYIHNQDNSDVLSNNEQITLTDVFHQFDTITLRGRTSIDRYLNIQRSMGMTNYGIDRRNIPLDSSRIVDISPISRRDEIVTIQETNGQIKRILPTQNYHSIKHDGECKQ